MRKCSISRFPLLTSVFGWVTAVFAVIGFTQPALAQTATAPSTQPSAIPAFHAWATTPPMGWNSWDCFGPAASEEAVLANADYMAKNLKSHGWEYVIIDGRWCRPGTFMPHGKEGMDLEMDEHGRL